MKYSFWVSLIVGFTFCTCAHGQTLEVDNLPPSARDLGVSAYNLGQYEVAIHQLNLALESNPSDGEAFANRGNAYAMIGDYASALRDFDEAVRLIPGNAEMYYLRGITYADNGDLWRGRYDLDRAISISPGETRYHESRRLIEEAIQRQGQQDFSKVRECVLSASASLERSREDADVVAEAAVQQCYAELTAVSASFVNFNGGDIRETRESFRSTLYQESLQRIVSIRASRAQ